MTSILKEIKNRTEQNRKYQCFIENEIKVLIPEMFVQLEIIYLYFVYWNICLCVYHDSDVFFVADHGQKIGILLL